MLTARPPRAAPRRPRLSKEIEKNATVLGTSFSLLYSFTFQMSHLDHDNGIEPDDVDEPAHQQEEYEWLSRLCGSGARLWPHVSQELTYLCAAAALAILGAILSATCATSRCYVLGTNLGRWLEWAAFSCAISVPGRVIDKLVFASLSVLGDVLAGGLTGLALLVVE